MKEKGSMTECLGLWEIASEEMLDFGGGGYNMYGGYARSVKAAQSANGIAHTIEEFEGNFAIFSFESKGNMPKMTIVANLEAEGTHASAKIDIIPTEVWEGGVKLDDAYAKYANRVGIKEYKTAVEAWAKGKGFKSIQYHGERATGPATGRIQNSKKYDLK